MTKRVLITGASRGIGKAIALHLASQKEYELVLHYHSKQTLAQDVQHQVEELGSKASLISFDIADRAACEKAITADIEQNGAYYGVVCNAGVNRDNSFPVMEGVEWDKVIHTNLDGFYNVLHPVVMPMVSNRIHGRIITLSSISGVIGNRGQVNYSASKAGIIGATKALALELAKHKITVNCVAPGIIETDMTKDLPLDEVKKLIPCRRLGKPEEVASLVGYLMSESAAYLTRQVISVNGGMI